VDIFSGDSAGDIEGSFVIIEFVANTKRLHIKQVNLGPVVNSVSVE
jgi:hypothetical protein